MDVPTVVVVVEEVVVVVAEPDPDPPPPHALKISAVTAIPANCNNFIDFPLGCAMPEIFIRTY
jgi:hypothetical protein